MRFTLAVATALVFAGVPSPAQAAEPTHGPLGPFTAQLVIADECPFVVHELATFSGSVTVWYADDTTTPVRFNAAVVETDVFSANGKTLTTEPYHYSSRGSFDAAGQQTTAIDTGVVVKLKLPDGSMFVAAGRADILGGQTLLTPDVGTSGNVAGFCAALSP